MVLYCGIHVLQNKTQLVFFLNGETWHISVKDMVDIHSESITWFSIKEYWYYEDFKLAVTLQANMEPEKPITCD